MSGSQETWTDTEIRSRVSDQMLGLLNLLMWRFNQSLQLAYLSVLCLGHTYDLMTFLLLPQVERVLRGRWLCHCLTTHLDFCLLLSVWLMMTFTLSTGPDILTHHVFWDPAQASFSFAKPFPATLHPKWRAFLPGLSAQNRLHTGQKLVPIFHLSVIFQ